MSPLRVGRRAIGLAANLAACGAFFGTAAVLYAEPPPATPAATPGDTAGLVESTWRELGLDPRDIGLRDEDLAVMVGRGRRPELAQLLIRRPLRADAVTRVLGEELTAGGRDHPTELLAAVSRWNNRVVRRALLGDPLAAARARATDPEARRTLLIEAGLTAADCDRLPASVQEAAALLLLAGREARTWVRRATADIDTPAHAAARQRLIARLLEPPPANATSQPADQPPDSDIERTIKRWTDGFATECMMVAAQDLLLAVEFARQRLTSDPSLPSAAFHVAFDSDLGRVVLADARDDVHDRATAPALLIDTGGHDRYANAGAAHPDQPISLALDLGGDDTYDAGSRSVGTFGAGLLGVGVLYDVAGHDRYVGGRFSQGAAAHGVGLLIDGDGDDAYSAIAESQAAATAGAAVLLDRAGRDLYESFHGSQAFAGPAGAAVLLDLGGADRYLANDTDLRYPSAQNPQHNNSMSQGAACGWRADYVDGVSLGGGVAALIDAAGDDEYSCGVFGQGSGYWYGLGLLIHLAGDDRYTGHWYVQGAAAHYAAGVLADRGGDDRYTANQNMSQGAGHDLSIGVLIDAAGHDVYLGSTLGLGAANAAGIGVFIDQAGDDRYAVTSGECLGWANSSSGLRSLMTAYGLFVDLAGEDRYEPRTTDGTVRAGVGNQRRWATPNRGPDVIGWGVDR